MKKHKGIYIPDDDSEIESVLGGVEPDKYLQRPYTWALKCVHKPHKRTAIDIGAHVGLASIRFAKKFKHVVSIEADDNNFACLLANTEKIYNINPIHRAIGHRHGLCKFARSIIGKSGHGFVADDSCPAIPDSMKVVPQEMATLDSIVTKLKLDNIALIKIDVQGYEQNVLQGARNTLRKFRPVVIVEEHYDNYETQPNRAVGWLVYRMGGYFIGRDKRNHVISLKSPYDRDGGEQEVQGEGEQADS